MKSWYLSHKVHLHSNQIPKSDVIGTVIRPAYVFGKRSKHFYPYFKQALEGKVVVQGNPNIIWSEVHIDDLIAGYIKIIQGIPALMQEITNLSTYKRSCRSSF